MYRAGMTANDTSGAPIVHRQGNVSPSTGFPSNPGGSTGVDTGAMRNLKALWFAGLGLALAATAALEWTGFDLFLPYLVER